MKTWVYIATSLDGYIARENGDIDWLMSIENPTDDDFGYRDFISSIDGIVIGRGTYEKVLTFPSWPYDRKVYVLSTTLKSVPEPLKEKITLLSMKPKEVLARLSSQGHAGLYIDGGKVIQDFLRDDCIDEMIITKIPVLIGSGIPLFGNLPADLQFKHLHTQIFPNGLVKSHYTRLRG